MMAAYLTEQPIYGNGGVGSPVIAEALGLLSPLQTQSTQISNLTPVSRYLADQGLTGNCNG